MRFTPFAFMGGQAAADLYYDVNNPESYQSGSTTWYNIGTKKNTWPTNLTISSSWYQTDSTGSFIKPPTSTQIDFSTEPTNLPTVSTYIYQIQLNVGVANQRLMGHDLTGTVYACAMDASAPPFFGARVNFSTYISTLAVTLTMENQFFYLAVINDYTGGGYGNTTYRTSLDNFVTAYPVSFSPGQGVAFAFDRLQYIIKGLGKLKTIGAYYGRILSAAELQQYALTGPNI